MRLLTALAIVATAYGQTFEVASVKPAPPPDGRGMRVAMRGGPGTDDPGLWVCENVSLSGLITSAYELERYQYSGPSWTDEVRFNVSATVPPGTTKQQFRVMQQSLLAERFKLTFHREKKESTAGFELMVARGGPKFKEASKAAEEESSEKERSGPLKMDAKGFPELPRSKGYTMAMAAGRGAMHSPEETMEAFSQKLSGQLRQPVSDVTGLTGKYDISLYWVVGEPSSENDGPSLFQALQEQLGLKLQAKKVTVDMFIVYHAEKSATEN